MDKVRLPQGGLSGMNDRITDSVLASKTMDAAAAAALLHDGMTIGMS